MTIEYICWMELNYPHVKKQIRSCEVVYYKGHKHGVIPTSNDWMICYNSLVLNGSSSNVPLATIKSYAEKCTKSKK